MAYFTTKINSQIKIEIMTSNLRKAHKIIWMLLLITIPVVMVLAVLEIKKPAINDDDLVLSEARLGRLVSENESFSISVGKGGEIDNLQVILKRPLKNPSAVVYGASSEDKKEYFIGVINEKGLYNFQLNKSTKEVRIYDAIKKEDIINIKL